MTTPLVALGAALLLLVLAAVLRAGGASLVRTPRADALHDSADGNRKAARVAELLDDRPQLQPSLGMVHTGLLVLLAVPATWALSSLLSGSDLLIALVLFSMATVVFGDVLPRSIGRRRPRVIAYRFSRLLELAVNFGQRASDFIVEDEDDEEEEDDDLSDSEERNLISSVLEFSDTLVREVMVPRPDMISLSARATSEDALDVVIEEGRSRIPVLGESVDDVLGILYARDLLRLRDAADRSQPADKLMRPAYFVPETKRVPELLREMQAKQIHLAIVVDEFGGTAGLVTIEDLLEELVGEIADEYDEEEPLVTSLPDGGYLVDAKLAMDDFVDLLGVEASDEECDTVGGLVLVLAGRVPREGEAFDYAKHRLIAERVQGRRVARVRVLAS